MQENLSDFDQEETDRAIAISLSEVDPDPKGKKVVGKQFVFVQKIILKMWQYKLIKQPVQFLQLKFMLISLRLNYRGIEKKLSQVVIEANIFLTTFVDHESDEDVCIADIESSDDEEPVKVEPEKDEQLSKVQLEEDDEQYARALQESLYVNSPPRQDHGGLFQPYPFLFPSGYR